MLGYAPEPLQDTSVLVFYPSTTEFGQIGALGLKAMVGSGRDLDERFMRSPSGGLFCRRLRSERLTPKSPFARSVTP